MKLGIGSWTFGWAVGVPAHMPAKPMTARDLLARARALGVGVVQIADNLPLDRLPESDIETISAAAVAWGIAVEVGTRGIAPGNLRRYLALARRLRSPIVRVVIDTADHQPSPADVVNILRPLMAEFEQAGVTLAIENHDRFKARTFASIVEQVGSPQLGICLDTVNSFGALEGPETVVDVLAAHTVNLHVKDFVVRRAGSMMGFSIEGKPAGQGQLDVPWLLASLQAAARRPNAIIELWTPPAATLEETIAIEQAWAEASIRYMRTLIAD